MNNINAVDALVCRYRVGLSCKDLAVALTSCSFFSVIRRLSGHIQMQQISLDRRSPIGLEGIALFRDVGQVCLNYPNI